MNWSRLRMHGWVHQPSGMASSWSSQRTSSRLTVWMCVDSTLTGDTKSDILQSSVLTRVEEAHNQLIFSTAAWSRSFASTSTAASNRRLSFRTDLVDIVEDPVTDASQTNSLTNTSSRLLGDRSVNCLGLPSCFFGCGMSWTAEASSRSCVTVPFCDLVRKFQKCSSCTGEAIARRFPSLSYIDLGGITSSWWGCFPIFMNRSALPPNGR